MGLLRWLHACIYSGHFWCCIFLQFALAFASAMTPFTHSALFAEDTNAHVLTHTHAHTYAHTNTYTFTHMHTQS